MLNGEEEFRNGLKCLEVPSGCNIREAMVFFEKATNEGHIEAAYRMGCCYLCGEPQVARNCKEAMKYFEKCANAGLSRAKYFMGIFYLWGIAVEKDERKAFHLLEEAFKEGIFEAASLLSGCYSKGVGTEEDIQKAEWYNDCARQMNLPGAEREFLNLCGMNNWRESTLGSFAEN